MPAALLRQLEKATPLLILTTLDYSMSPKTGLLHITVVLTLRTGLF